MLLDTKSITPYQIVNTIAHELEHARQYQLAPDSYETLTARLNLSPQHYIHYMDYYVTDAGCDFVNTLHFMQPAEYHARVAAEEALILFLAENGLDKTSAEYHEVSQLHESIDAMQSISDLGISMDPEQDFKDIELS